MKSDRDRRLLRLAWVTAVASVCTTAALLYLAVHTYRRDREAQKPALNVQLTVLRDAFKAARAADGYRVALDLQLGFTNAGTEPVILGDMHFKFRDLGFKEVDFADDPPVAEETADFFLPLQPGETRLKAYHAVYSLAWTKNPTPGSTDRSSRDADRHMWGFLEVVVQGPTVAASPVVGPWLLNFSDENPAGDLDISNPLYTNLGRSSFLYAMRPGDMLAADSLATLYQKMPKRPDEKTPASPAKP